MNAPGWQAAKRSTLPKVRVAREGVRVNVKAKRLAIALTVPAALGALLVLWTRQGRPPVVGEARTDPAVVSAEKRIQEPELSRQSSSERSERSTAKESVFHLSVVDARFGDPIEGAVLLDRIPAGRVVISNSEGVLGITDRDGKVEIERKAIADQDHWVLATGRTPERVDSSRFADGEEVVLLSQGCSLRVECRDLEGNPIESCKIVVSRAQLPPQSVQTQMLTEGITAGLGKAGIHWKTTDAAGVATLEGLEEGSYLVSVVREGYAFLETSSPDGVTVPVEPLVSLTLVPIGAVVFEIISDEMLGHQMRHSSHFHSSRSSKDLRREEDRLRSRFPKATVAAFILEKETGADAVEVAAFLRDRGKIDFEIPLRVLSQIHEAIRVDVSDRPLQEASYPTPVRIRDLRGRPIPAGLFWMVMDNEMEIPLSDGTPWLPAGRHRIQCQDSRLAGSFLPTEAVIPGEIDIEVRYSLTPCRLNVVDTEGNRYDSFFLTTRSGGRSTNQLLLDNRNKTLLLPAGSAMFTVKVWGFEDTQAEVEILQVNETQEINLTVSRDR